MPGGETASGGEEQGICRNELKSISWHYEFFGPTPYKIIDNLCTNSPSLHYPTALYSMYVYAVYYCRTYEKAVSGGEREGKGRTCAKGHY